MWAGFVSLISFFKQVDYRVPAGINASLLRFESGDDSRVRVRGPIARPHRFCDA